VLCIVFYWDFSHSSWEVGGLLSFALASASFGLEHCLWGLLRFIVANLVFSKLEALI